MKPLMLLALLLLQEAPVQRIPEPDADAQKQALKSLKDLFKDEYAKKAGTDQADLARKLLKTSADAGLDSTTRYVCIIEARDLAAAAGDVDLAMEAVATLGKSFTVAVRGGRR